MELDLNTMTGALKYCKEKGWLKNAIFEIKEKKNKLSIEISDLSLTSNYYVHSYLKSKSLKKMSYDEIQDVIFNARQRNTIKNFSYKFNNVNLLPGDIFRIRNKTYQLLNYDGEFDRFKVKDLDYDLFNYIDLFHCDRSILLDSKLKNDIINFNHSSLKNIKTKINYYSHCCSKDNIPKINNYIFGDYDYELLCSSDSDDSYSFDFDTDEEEIDLYKDSDDNYSDIYDFVCKPNSNKSYYYLEVEEDENSIDKSIIEYKKPSNIDLFNDKSLLNIDVVFDLNKKRNYLSNLLDTKIYNWDDVIFKFNNKINLLEDIKPIKSIKVIENVKNMDIIKPDVYPQLIKEIDFKPIKPIVKPKYISVFPKEYRFQCKECNRNELSCFPNRNLCIICKFKNTLKEKMDNKVLEQKVDNILKKTDNELDLENKKNNSKCLIM